MTKSNPYPSSGPIRGLLPEIAAGWVFGLDPGALFWSIYLPGAIRGALIRGDMSVADHSNHRMDRDVESPLEMAIVSSGCKHWPTPWWQSGRVVHAGIIGRRRGLIERRRPL